MKIAVCSDLHMEFAPISLDNTEGAEVLILSGDICVAEDVSTRDVYGFNDSEKMLRVHIFFKECCERFNHVLYVLGNHEHYHGDFRHTLTSLRSNLDYLPNLHILEKEFVQIGDTMFFGATLWTDMNKEDPNTLFGIKSHMNDFRVITDVDTEVFFRDQNGKSHSRTGYFTPELSVKEHKETLKFLKEAVESRPTDKWVVVGHHAPSKLSTHPRYRDQVIENGAFSSDLSEFILDHPQIKLWTHGHTHDRFDYMIGDTRVFANPRGYHMYEDQAASFELKFVEV